MKQKVGSSTFTQESTSFDMTHDLTVPDEAYGAGWNGSLEVPTKNAVYDKIEATQGYLITGGTSITSPADATTYYGGVGPFALSVNQGAHRIYIPKAGTIKATYIVTVNNGTVGSSETSSVYIRLNETTDTLISSGVTNNSASSTPAAVSNTSMSISVAAGDFIEVKWVTPTWTTNPAQVILQHCIYIE